MKISDLKSKKAQKIFKDFNVSKVYVFGSLARGEFKEGSDVDLLVSFSKTPSLIKYIKFINSLENTFQTPFDVVTEKSILPQLKRYITSDLKKVYEED